MASGCRRRNIHHRAAQPELNTANTRPEEGDVSPPACVSCRLVLMKHYSTAYAKLDHVLLGEPACVTPTHLNVACAHNTGRLTWILHRNTTVAAHEHSVDAFRDDCDVERKKCYILGRDFKGNRERL